MENKNTIRSVVVKSVEPTDYSKMHRETAEKYDSIKDAQVISSWEELENQVSETHELEVDLYYGNGWIREKNGDKDWYLSTHTFYESQYKMSTLLLQKCGFNVKLTSWG